MNTDKNTALYEKITLLPFRSLAITGMKDLPGTCRTPEELFDILLSDFQDFAMICRTRGRREVTEADEKAVEELCQPYLDWRKEALK